MYLGVGGDAELVAGLLGKDPRDMIGELVHMGDQTGKSGKSCRRFAFSGDSDVQLAIRFKSLT
jgi:hypothetical protein